MIAQVHEEVILPTFLIHGRPAPDFICPRQPSRVLGRRRKLRAVILAAFGERATVVRGGNRSMGGLLWINLLPGRHPRLEISRISAGSTSLTLS